MKETPAITAFLDANVLYPALLRDLLLRLASSQMFRPLWSAKVLDEWTTALSHNRADIPASRIARTRQLMETHFPDALVTGYEHRITSLSLPDADDRHVLAAAIHAEAPVIVTMNSRDFPASVLTGHGIEAVHPDAFILGMIDTDRAQVAATIERLRLAYQNPPISSDRLIALLKDHGLFGSATALEV